jgi:alginate O-acetyltransferase complex protein AlgI
MLFSSPEFLLLFLPITLVGYYVSLIYLGPAQARLFLLGASILFYSWWDVRYLPLLLISILVNYQIGITLSKMHSRCVLGAGLLFNLGLLAYFKYVDFFIDATNQLAGTHFELPHIILPLALSFFTFQQIAYVVDTYKTDTPRYGFVEYSLFISFFPQLIAGPIVHHTHLLPQFRSIQKGQLPSAYTVAQGLTLIIVGLFKKVVIADSLAKYVHPAFSSVVTLGFLEAWTALLAYTIQIYMDFSGYCEIAMGLGLLFGFSIPLNFNSPYQATNIADFWRRWNITLGQFLRDYVYIPLGGNRRGQARMAIALLVTMLLGGLWHGAGWQFVAWGALHGLYLVIFMAWRGTTINLPRWVAILVTFFAVMMAWVLFRADSISDAMTFIGVLFGSHGFTLPDLYQNSAIQAWFSIRHSAYINGSEIWLIGLLVVFVLYNHNIHQYRMTLSPSLRQVFLMTSLAGFVVFNLGSPSDFLYFDF